MKILLADDHAILRGGLKLVLNEAFHNVEFGEAEDAPQALAAALYLTGRPTPLDLPLCSRGCL